MANGRAVVRGYPEERGGRQLAPADGNTTLRGPYGPATYSEEPPDDDLRRLLLEYVRILVKRKWLILAFVLAAVAIGAVRTYLITPLYTATVRIQIDQKAIKVVEGGQVEQSDGSADFLRTQMELLRSAGVAERVVALAGLGDDPEFIRPRQFSFMAAVADIFKGTAGDDEAVPGKAMRDAIASRILIANQAVRPVPGSRLVDVSYSDPSPARAQRIANAYADAFIASNLDKRLQANVYAKAFLEDQLGQLKLRLEDAEKAVIAFAEKEEFVITSEKASIAESNLSAANTALGGLVADRIKAEQLWRQVADIDAINLPQFLLNPVIQGLRASRNTLDGEYKEKRQTFKPGYPAMIELNNRIRELDRQIATEVKAIKESHKAAYDQALRQEREMLARIEQLRVETLDLQRRQIQYNNLKREASTLRTLYEGLLQRHKEVDVAGGIGANNIFIVDKAMRPSLPSSPDFSRAFLLSLLLGLGGGVGAAYLLERLDDAVRGPEEIERLTGLPTLGVIPEAGKGATAEEDLLNPRSAIAEAYRSLCTALQFSTEEGLPRSLLVTSAAPSEGKSITALAIARHFASMGLRVLVIDADMRNPSLHDKLGVDNSVGMSNYLTGELTPPQTFQATAQDRLTFMATGPLPADAAGLLAGPRLLSLLSVGRETFDLIVLDCPPVMGLADAPLLSNAAGATIFVVGAGLSRAGQIRGAIKRLQFARGPVVGTVLTRFDVRTGAYGYGYDYGYGYGGDPYGHGKQVGDDKGQQRRLTQG